MGDFVEHGVADPFTPDHLVAFEDREVLGQQCRFQPGRGQDLGDPGRLAGSRQDLQDPDSGRVGQRFEQVRLDLIKRPLMTAREAVGHRCTPESMNWWIERKLNLA